MATPQKRMEEMLGRAGIPAKHIRCYGSQVIVTCWSRDAAERFHTLLHKFCRTVRGPVKSRENNIENRNTVLRPSGHTVWLVAGTI